jgi:hypothetical protein
MGKKGKTLLPQRHEEALEMGEIRPMKTFKNIEGK